MPLLRAVPPQLQEDAQQQEQLSPGAVLRAACQQQAPLHIEHASVPAHPPGQMLPLRALPVVLQGSNSLCQECRRGSKPGCLRTTVNGMLLLTGLPVMLQEGHIALRKLQQVLSWSCDAAAVLLLTGLPAPLQESCTGLHHCSRS